jgi:DNA polymerase-3 subunit epsilon
MPLFNKIAQEFLDFIDGGTMVIHNAPFDIKFLNHELSLLKLPSLELSSAIDTLTIARKRFPGAKVHLDALCRRFKIDNSSREYHGALKDAELLAEVYVELMGGRQTSFALKDKITAKNSEDEISGQAIGNKIVINPTKEELIMHESFIKNLHN